MTQEDESAGYLNTLRDPGTVERFIGSVPEDAPQAVKDQLAELATRGVAATLAGNTPEATTTAEETNSLLTSLGSPTSCHANCKYWLDRGRPDMYAMCVWACLVSGGGTQT